MKKEATEIRIPFLNTQYISVKGVKTRYIVSGAGEVVLFLHGFPETLQTWRLIIPEISQHFKTIAFDLKGFGCSDKPEGDYSPWGMAQFVKDFIDALGIDTPVYMVGTDIGLTIACAFALSYPKKINKLILMAGTVYKEGIIAPEIKLLSMKPLGEIVLRIFGKWAIKMGLQKGFYKKDFISQEIFKEYYEPYREPRAIKCLLELIRSFNKAVPQLVSEVKNIAIPTLILWARQERFFSFEVAQRLCKDIKNSRLEIVSDCGHFIQEEKPAESIKILLSFLDESRF